MKKKKYLKRTAVVITLTPKIAKAFLATRENGPQRRLTLNKVEKYKDALKAGKWLDTGQSISIDCYGNILNGSQRCEAVVQTGISMPNQTICYGIPTKSFKVMDAGKSRSMADCLYAANENHSNTLATTLRQVDKYLSGNVPTPGPRLCFHNEDALKLLKKYPQIRESVQIGAKLTKLGATATIATCHFICSLKNRAQADDFFDRLYSGANLSKNSPVLILREALLDIKRGSYREERKEIKVARILYAWNAERKDRKVTTLKWNKKLEKFPRAV